MALSLGYEAAVEIAVLIQIGLLHLLDTYTSGMETCYCFVYNVIFATITFYFTVIR